MKAFVSSRNQEFVGVIPDGDRFYSISFDKDGTLKNASRFDYIDIAKYREVDIMSLRAGGITAFIDMLYDFVDGRPMPVHMGIEGAKLTIAANALGVFGQYFNEMKEARQ